MSAARNLPPFYYPEEEPEQPAPPPRPARWKRIARWVVGTLGVLVILLIVGGYVLLHNQSFHRYVLRVAQQKATSAVGTKVEVRDFALHFSGLSPNLDLYNVVVHGAPPYADPPLLAVEHVYVGVRVVSLISRKWYLEDVQIQRPAVRVFVDSHGIDNLPHAKKQNQQSQTSIFDLGIRHLLLDTGEAYYNNRKSVLNADLHDVNFESRFDAAQKRYAGKLSYRDGRLKMENFNPIPHNLTAEFEATPQAFILKRAVLASGNSSFSLNATVEDYQHPRVQAAYDARLDAGEFRRILKNASLPSGIIHAAGNLHYASRADTPMLGVLVLQGNLGSSALEVKTATLHATIRDLGARYALAGGNLEVREMRARLLGGQLNGNLTIRDLVGASQSRLQAALRGLSLAEAKGALSSAALEKVAVAGTVNADANATWGRTFDNLVARGNAALEARIASREKPSNALPLTGALHFSYAQASKQMALANSYVRTPRTAIDLNGAISQRSNLQIAARSNDLHELESIANDFHATGAPPLGLYGTAAFNGNVRGSLAAPQMAGQLTAANLQLHGTSWRSLRTGISLSPALASLTNGELQPMNRGRITFAVSAGLKHWSFTPSSPIQVSLNAAQLNATDLARAAGVQMPVKGTLSANLALHGSELDPIGLGKLSLTNGQISAEPVQSLAATFNGTGEVVHANLALQIPAGAAESNLTYYPKTQVYDVNLSAPGIQLAQLETVKARNLQLAGVLKLIANGRGSLKNPQLIASLQIPELRVKDKVISHLDLQAGVANQVANFTLDSSVLNTAIRGRGTVNLQQNYYADVTLDTQSIPLQPLVAIYAPAQAANLTGETELHAKLRGPLKDKAFVEAHVTIPKLGMNYKNTIQIAAAAPIQMDYSNGILQLQRTALRGTGTDLQLQGTVPLTSNAPASMLALGTIDLRLAQLLDPEIASSGLLRFNIDSYGRRSDPNVQGQIQVVNAGFASGDLPLGLEKGNGILTLTKDRLDITEFTGTVGGGTASVSGGVAYRPSLNFNLALHGDGIRLLYADSIRTRLGTNLALTGTTQAATLHGQVRVDQVSFTPDFDLMNFIGQIGGDTVPAPSQGMAGNVQLDIGVASTSGINLASRELTINGVANLNVRGTAAQPVILGRVNLSSGDLIFMGNRYVLQGGTLDFVNPYQTQPVVNVAVNTTIQEYKIQLHFDGPADHLHTNYASDPALPPADIINLLAFGKTTEASAANPTPPGALGAQSLVAKQVTNQVTSRLEKVAGISQLSVDPELGGNQQNPGARVAVQQRVTSNLFVTFATDVTSTQRAVIKLEYHVTPRVSVSATRDENGGFGMLTRIHKSW